MANFADVVKKVLQEHDPNIDMSGGTAAQDILVNAPEYILNYIFSAMKVLEDERDTSDVTLLSEDKLNRVGNQLLVPRGEGIKSTGVVRLYFIVPTTKTCPAGTIFETSRGLKFAAKRTTTITAAQMALNIEGKYYYMDIPSVEAIEAGSQYSISAYSIVKMVGQPADLVKCTNPNEFTTGANAQNNLDYIDAIKTGISVRDLVSRNSIHTMLAQKFPQYPKYYVAGYKDKEMERDTVYGMHIGGCVDIYPQVHTYLTYQTSLVPASGYSYNTQPVIFIRKDAISGTMDYTNSTIVDLPVCSIESIEKRNSDGTYTPLVPVGYNETPPTVNTSGYYMRIPLGAYQLGMTVPAGVSGEFWNPKQYYAYTTVPSTSILTPSPLNCALVHSVMEESVLVLVANRTGLKYTPLDTFRITYTGVDPTIAKSMQLYVDDEIGKTLDADHLVRSMIPCYVDVTARTVGGDSSTLRTAVQQMILDAETLDDITVSGLIDTLVKSGATSVDLPITITDFFYYRMHLPNGHYYQGAPTNVGKINLAEVWQDYTYVNKNIRFLPGTISITVVSV